MWLCSARWQAQKNNIMSRKYMSFGYSKQNELICNNCTSQWLGIIYLLDAIKKIPCTHNVMAFFLNFTSLFILTIEKNGLLNFLFHRNKYVNLFINECHYIKHYCKYIIYQKFNIQL